MEARDNVTVRHISNIVRLLTVSDKYLRHLIKVTVFERFRCVVTWGTLVARSADAICEVVHALVLAVSTVLAVA